MAFVRVDDKWLRGDFHDYHDKGRLAPGKVTHRFAVYDRRSGTFMGYVKWHAPWRQYTFFGVNSVMMSKMHREIAEFLEMVTREHKTNKSKE